jgi:hypothetical protein
MSQYNYPHTAFANDTWNEDRLKEEVAQNFTITTELSGIKSVETTANEEPTGNFTVSFIFPADLSTEEKTALDALVASHTGMPPTQCRFLASSTIIGKEESITEADWTVLGGVVTTPQFFCPNNLPGLKARIVGSYKTDGNGAQIRIVEDGTTVLGTFALPGTASVWTQMQWFTTTSPSEGTHEYTIEAIKGAAGSAFVRYVSMSLLEFYCE